MTVPTFFLATFILFFLLRVVSGSGALDKAMHASGAVLHDSSRTAAALKKEMGLDQPIYIQYVVYMGNIFRGEFGRSFWGERDQVWHTLAYTIPVTAKLAVLSVLISVSIGIVVGVISAVRQDTVTDYLLRTFSIGLLAIPNFWIATLVVVLPAYYFRVLPPLFYVSWKEDPVGNLGMFIVPALVLGTQGSAGMMRMTRSMMLEVMRQDYIRTAKAKGLSEASVLYKHALKNALIPVVTILGGQVVGRLGGTVIIESIFGLPGVGTATVGAVRFSDYPMVQGVNIFFITIVMTMNLIVDISYGYLDPRIRYR